MASAGALKSQFSNSKQKIEFKMYFDVGLVIIVTKEDNKSSCYDYLKEWGTSNAK